MANFLEYDLLKNIILPFVLIFTLIFALLEKSKILGESKQQINAIISLVIAAILVTFSAQIVWIRQFVVFLAVALFILFMFLMMYGFIFGTKDDILKDNKFLKYALASIAFVAVVIAVLLITDTWQKLVDFYNNGETGSNILLVLVIVGAVVAVLFGTGKSKSSENK